MGFWVPHLFINQSNFIFKMSIDVRSLCKISFAESLCKISFEKVHLETTSFVQCSLYVY